MKLGLMVGGGILVVGCGMFVAWLFDDRRTAQAAISDQAAVSNETVIADAEPGVVTLAAGDEGMSEARRNAHATFNQFWNRVSTDRTGLDAISIKVAVPHANGSEHLWMTGCQSVDAANFNCVVSNNPVEVDLKLGTRYQFARADISDWMYRQNGKIHGGYSIRELLPTMPANQAAQMNAMLAPLPQ